MLAMEDRYDEAHSAGLDALKLIPGPIPFADNALRNVMAHLCSMQGNPEDARRLLEFAREASDSADFNRGSAEVIEGMLNLFEGRFRQAVARFRIASESQFSSGVFPQHSDTWIGIFQACVMYQVDDLDQAEQQFNIVRPHTRETGLPDHLILSFGLGARIAFHRGDIDHALRLLAELEFLGHKRHLPRAVAGARLERARILLWQEKEDAVRDELARVDTPGAWPADPARRLFAHDLDYPALATARCDLTFGQPQVALATLDREIEDTRLRNRPRRLLKLHLLRSAALYHSGRTDAALQLFGDVVRTTASEGFLRFIVDEGPAFHPLICAHYHKLVGANSGDPSDNAVLTSHLRHISRTGKFSLEPMNSGTPLPESDGIQLTPKEQRILLLLADGFSNTAMAEKLFVSDSTVRTHLRNINIKLGAGSRAQAVAAARRWGLVR